MPKSALLLMEDINMQPIMISKKKATKENSPQSNAELLKMIQNLAARVDKLDKKKV